MKDEEGTTNVLGAILVVALLFTVMANVETNFRPVWDEEKEAEHLQGVINQFADLKSEIEKQTGNRTLAPVSNPMTLEAPGRGGWFSTEPSIGDLEFLPGTINTTVSAPLMVAIERDGKPLGALNEAWTTAGTTSELEDIQRLDALRLRITKDEDTDKFEFEKNMYIKAEITDADGEFAGWFRAYVPEKEKHDIWIEIVTASGEVLINQEIAADVKYKEHFTFWIDALDPSWPFQQVLDATKAPYDILITHSWNSNDDKKTHVLEYSHAYIRASETGQVVYEGGGAGSGAQFQDQRSGGRLSFHVPYDELPDVEVVVEHGALIINQTEGASMVMLPSVTAERLGTQTIVSISTPVLQGTTDRIGGRASAVVVTTALQESSVLGLADTLDLTIGTEFPRLWATFYDDLLTEAGLQSGSEYTVQQYPDEVRISIKGSSDSAGVLDVQTHLKTTVIGVKLR